LIGQTIAQYKILERLGEGGMGVVYKAEDTRLKRNVALKFLPPEMAGDTAARKRFVREAQAASAIQHHNICTIHDVNETEDGRVFISMECYDGETLKDKIARGPLAVDETLNIAIQAADGLSSAHGAGTVHRDIKPANIVVTNKGVVKTLDFGLATLMGMTRLTRPGMTVGTVAYMSPEQATGREVDHRSDIWSLGAVLYETLTGELPFEGDHEQAVIYRILNEDSKPLSESRGDVPDQLAASVEKMLKKNADDRYQHISDLLADLKTVTTAPERGAANIEGEHELGPRAVHENRRAVAVLPFKMLSGEAEFEFLSLALAEAVSHGLSLNPELTVRPTSAVVRYAQRDVDPMLVARELNVVVAVEGSFQKLGPNVRVQVQAWDAAAGSTLLSVKLDGQMDDLFGLQDRLAELLVKGMGLDEAGWHSEEPPTKNARSYELFLRASERLLRYSQTDTNRAIEMLRSAVELDPGFASAWARLAAGLVSMGAIFDPDSRWYVEAETAVQRALALDASNPEAWSARGRILWSPHHGFQHANALRNLHKACCLPGCPAEAPLWRGIVLSHIGLHDEALSVVREVQESQPDDPMGAVIIGETLGWDGDTNGFLETMRDAIVRDPAFYFTHLFLPIPLLYLGELEEAESAIRSAQGILGDDSMIQAGTALLWAKRGEPERSEEILRGMFEHMQSVSHAHHAYHIAATAYATIGDASRAVQMLERAVEAGLPNYPAFMKDPHFAPLGERPDFKKLMSKLKTTWESFRAEFGEG